MINTDSQYEQQDNGRLAWWVDGEQVGLCFLPFQPSLFQSQLVSMSITLLCIFSLFFGRMKFPPLDIDLVEQLAKQARALETKRCLQQRKQTACSGTFSSIFGLIFSTFLNCSDEILPFLSTLVSYLNLSNHTPNANIFAFMQKQTPLTKPNLPNQTC